MTRHATALNNHHCDKLTGFVVPRLHCLGIQLVNDPTILLLESNWKKTLNFKLILLLWLQQIIELRTWSIYCPTGSQGNIFTMYCKHLHLYIPMNLCWFIDFAAWRRFGPRLQCTRVFLVRSLAGCLCCSENYTLYCKFINLNSNDFALKLSINSNPVLSIIGILCLIKRLRVRRCGKKSALNCSLQC